MYIVFRNILQQLLPSQSNVNSTTTFETAIKVVCIRASERATICSGFVSLCWLAVSAVAVMNNSLTDLRRLQLERDKSACR